MKKHLKKWRVLYLFVLFSIGILLCALEPLYFPIWGVIFRQDANHPYEYFIAIIGLADIIVLGYYWKKDFGGNFEN